MRPRHIAFAVLMSAGGGCQRSNDHHGVPARPSAGPEKTFHLYGATFSLPPQCDVACVHAVDAHHNTIRCSDLNTSIRYTAAPQFVIRRSLEPSAAVESYRAGGVVVYASQSIVSPSEYCVIATYQVDLRIPESLVNHQFCTLSPDIGLRARIRDIARSCVYPGTGSQPTCESLG